MELLRWRIRRLRVTAIPQAPRRSSALENDDTPLTDTQSPRLALTTGIRYYIWRAIRMDNRKAAADLRKHGDTTRASVKPGGALPRGHLPITTMHDREQRRR